MLRRAKDMLDMERKYGEALRELNQMVPFKEAGYFNMVFCNWNGKRCKFY